MKRYESFGRSETRVDSCRSPEVMGLRAPEVSCMTASILAEEVTHADYWLSMEAKLGFLWPSCEIIKSSNKTVTPFVLGVTES